jgi:anaerobic magnesium-protoporphyrin IX monomethyl ester cyclase
MPQIDCLIIGCNQMKFSDYVGNLKKMGEKSGAFRDLNLSFYEEDDNIVSCSNYYNKYYLPTGSEGEMNYDNIFSATISYLGTFLNKNQLSFAYINSFQENKGQLIKMLTENNVKTVAITTTYYVSVLPIIEVTEFIRRYDKNVKIIIGGPFLTTQYKIHNKSSFNYLINKIAAEFYVISSQGEQALVNIIKALKNGNGYENIPNIIYKTENSHKSNVLLEEDNQLNENIVNWSLFADYIKENQTRMVMVRSAKSCPFSCTFCSFPAHAGTYKYLTPQELFVELDQLIELETVNSVTFIDDTFNVPLGRFKEILRIFKSKGYRFRWNCNFRCQYADEEAVRLMREAGCEGVFLGIESGSDAILKNMNKSATTEAYKKGISLLKKYRIITYASFITGFPGETEDTIRETIDFIETAQPDFFRAQLWYYDTMTPIHKEAAKYGLENSQFEWSHNTMNSSEAANWVDFFYLNIKNSIWLPQNDFDFPSLFNLLSRGWSVHQIKQMLMEFNRKTNKKIIGDLTNAYFDPELMADSNFAF